MHIDKFALRVAQIEGKKKSVDIAQIKEILRIANQLTNGVLYKVIQLM